MAKTRKRYTERERARVIVAVERTGLTYAQASKRFGVSQVTIWKWRKAQKTGARGLRSRHVQANGSLARLMRTEVQARVREALPGIVREEVANCVQRMLGER